AEPLPAPLLSKRRRPFPFDRGFRPPIRRGAANSEPGSFLLPARRPGGDRIEVWPRPGRICCTGDERPALPPRPVLEIRPWNKHARCSLVRWSNGCPGRCTAGGFSTLLGRRCALY